MLPVKKRVDQYGRIDIREVMKISKIKPGDWVEIIPGTNKITIKIGKKIKPGVAAAGILKDSPELVDEMLRIRTSGG